MDNPNSHIGETCGKRKRGEIQETGKIDSGGCDGDIAKIDSVGCGGKIAKADSGVCGGELAKIDSGGVSDEKETREVKEFKDKYGLLERYKGKMAFEYDDYDPARKDENYDSDEAEPVIYMGEPGVEIESKEIKNDDEIKEIEKDPYDRETVLKYISQVRNSFGFDVDVRVPSWLMHYLSFIPIDLSYTNDHDRMYMAAKFAIGEINVDMKSKTFELVDVAKAVVVYAPRSLLFLTIDVKKVKEEEAACIQAIVYRPKPNTFKLHQWKVKPDASP
ncbi:hypothetical protein SASPL_103200 [Salvia splendens]|uniref:Uncharacterized protein n=1 Tax=Salvia splendens TaxID=180675 RepID=A0A8X8YSN2_SALSN|nr:uncharacterized protein LOC121755446 [Salvia splendens]KAG6438263.1 hypothetical protein SASPL_103200 [Salvia splendens]